MMRCLFLDGSVRKEGDSLPPSLRPSLPPYSAVFAPATVLRLCLVGLPVQGETSLVMRESIACPVQGDEIAPSPH